MSQGLFGDAGRIASRSPATALPPLDGHSCVVVGQHMIAYGGKISPQGLNPHCYALHMPTMSWRGLETESLPRARSYHTAVTLGTRMIVFGGLVALGLRDVHYNLFNVRVCCDALDADMRHRMGTDRFVEERDLPQVTQQNVDGEGLYELDLMPRQEGAALAWTCPRTSGSRPPTRCCHCATVHKGAMIVFGGYSVNGMGHRRDDEVSRDLTRVYSLDLTTYMWSTIDTSNGIPPVVWGASTVSVMDILLVFGGVDREANREVNTLCALHLARREWRWVTFYRDVPQHRGLHTAVTYGSTMIVFGGSGDVRCCDFNDCFSFDLTTGHWSAVVTHGDIPPAVSGHTAIVIGDIMYVFGGYSSATNSRNSNVYALHLPSATWRRCECGWEPVFITNLVERSLANSKLRAYHRRREMHKPPLPLVSDDPNTIPSEYSIRTHEQRTHHCPVATPTSERRHQTPHQPAQAHSPGDVQSILSGLRVPSRPQDSSEVEEAAFGGYRVNVNRTYEEEEDVGDASPTLLPDEPSKLHTPAPAFLSRPAPSPVIWPQHNVVQQQQPYTDVSDLPLTEEIRAQEQRVLEAIARRAHLPAPGTSQLDGSEMDGSNDSYGVSRVEPHARAPSPHHHPFGGAYEAMTKKWDLLTASLEKPPLLQTSPQQRDDDRSTGASTTPNPVIDVAPSSETSSKRNTYVSPSLTRLGLEQRLKSRGGAPLSNVTSVSAQRVPSTTVEGPLSAGYASIMNTAPKAVEEDTPRHDTTVLEHPLLHATSAGLSPNFEEWDDSAVKCITRPSREDPLEGATPSATAALIASASQRQGPVSEATDKHMAGSPMPGGGVPLPGAGRTITFKLSDTPSPGQISFEATPKTPPPSFDGDAQAATPKAATGQRPQRPTTTGSQQHPLLQFTTPRRFADVPIPYDATPPVPHPVPGLMK